MELGRLKKVVEKVENTKEQLQIEVEALKIDRVEIEARHKTER
jgi:hypothetical protein